MWAAEGSCVCFWVFGIIWGFQIVLLPGICRGLLWVGLVHLGWNPWEAVESVARAEHVLSLYFSSFWHILQPRCPLIAAALSTARCEASAVICLLQMGGLRFLTRFTWSLKRGQW